MKRIKRFIARNDSTQLIEFEANTTSKIYKFLLTKDLGLEGYYIECRVDDIEIHSNEFTEAFENNENPEDLQFF